MPQIPSLKPFVKRSLGWIIASIACTVTFSALYFMDNHYTIKHIVIINNPKEYVIAGLPAIENKSILFTQEEDIEAKIKKANAFIKSVEATKEYPDSISLRIEIYQPLANLKTREGFFLLGEEGVILGKIAEQANRRLPIITYYQEIPFALYQAGDVVSAKDIRDSMYFLTNLYEMRIPINSIDIAGFHMLGLYTEDKKYFFTAEKDRKVQLYDLKEAITAFKNRKTEYKSIDVRFDKPIIKF